MTETYSRRTFEQAVSWFVALQDEACDDKKRAGFQRWLTRNASHAVAYAEAERLWGTLDGMKTAEVPGVEAARNARPRARPSAGLGLALTVLLSVLGGWWLDFSAPTLLYGTGVGQRRSIGLEDGSLIEMNAKTQLQVRLSWLRRDIALLEGEAVFSVAHEPFRAFTVTAGDLQIRDIGTRFNVYHKENDTRVAVLEGEVALKPKGSWLDSELQAGFSRRFSNGRLQPVEAIDRNKESVWLDGRLVFEHTPLSEVVEELARYHEVGFVFADPSLAKLTLSGTFYTGDLHPFLNALEQMFPLRVKRQPDKVTLSRR